MTRKLLTVDEFRDAAKEGDQPEGTLLRATSGDPAEVADAPNTYRFRCSDETVDLAGDVIRQDGWANLKDFEQKNAVALWAHDSSLPPIGRWKNMAVVKRALVGDLEFAPEDANPLAGTLQKLVSGGFLNAVSVGFAPTKWEFAKDKDRPYGIDFIEQRLLEVSLCSIPCNPNALIEARSAGIDTGPLAEWAANILDGGGSVLVPRSLLEETFRKAKTPRAMRQKYLARAEAADWKVGAARDLPLDESDAWDGPAAAKRILDDAGFDGDSPDAAKAARGFLAHDAANPTLRGSYKLPFADIVGGELKADAGGIRAAASRLPQTDIPQSVQDDARKVLDGYESKMGQAGKRRAAFASLRKGLFEVGWLADLLATLAFIEDCVEYEAEYEGDGSDIPARLTEVLATLGQILIDMTAEEVAELLGEEASPEAADGPMLLTGRTSGQKAVLTLAAALRSKAGRRVSAATAAKMQEAIGHHDAATQCLKDILDSNEPEEPAADPEIIVPMTEAALRAQRLAEARALKALTNS